MIERRDSGRGLQLARGLVEGAGSVLTLNSTPLGLHVAIELPAARA